MQATTLTYALITPARNEAKYIEPTIQSVVKQTARPVKWVIVSDGSTDGTDDIVREYAAEHSWIELMRMPERAERHFAGKVIGIRAGYDRLKDLRFDAIGILDADVTFDETFFSFLLSKMAEEPRLGLVGSAFRDVGSDEAYDYRFVNIEHVSGPVQLFRRSCYDEIGGYVAIKMGGIDHIANLMCRMAGWKTRTFPEKIYLNMREMGTADRGVLGARFAYGKKDYTVGNHPLWEVCRTLYQMTKRPRLIGGASLGLGYLWCLIRNVKRPIPPEVVAFQRHEQMERLKKFLLRSSAS